MYRFLPVRPVILMLIEVLFLAGVTSPTLAQSPAGSTSSAATVAYQIGGGDLLSLKVAGVPRLDLITRVSNTGKIHIPYLDVIVVAGMTPGELEADVARRLKQGGLVNEPWVTVGIEQYRAQPVYILGEVMLPGQYVIKDQMYLMDLITLSGGFNDVATPVGYLYRRRVDSDGTPSADPIEDDALEIDFSSLNDGTKPELNVRLRGGDVLYVPQRRREFYYVVGDVFGPGAFELLPEALPTTTSRAIAMARGPMRTAKLSDGVLVRTGENGEHQEIPVDFKAILEGRRPDVLVQPDDIIFIPGSTAKTLAYGLLGTVPQAVERGAAAAGR